MTWREMSTTPYIVEWYTTCPGLVEKVMRMAGLTCHSFPFQLNFSLLSLKPSAVVQMLYLEAAHEIVCQAAADTIGVQRMSTETSVRPWRVAWEHRGASPLVMVGTSTFSPPRHCERSFLWIK